MGIFLKRNERIDITFENLSAAGSGQIESPQDTCLQLGGATGLSICRNAEFHDNRSAV